MKKTISLLTILTVGLANAQFQNNMGSMGQSNQNLNSGIVRENLIDKREGYDIQGSPFIFKNYVKAEIEGSNTTTFIRYNALKDEVEIKEGSNVLVLPKEDRYGKINIPDTKEKLRLTTYNDGKKSVTGYLFLIAEKEDLKLYKKEKVNFIKEKISNSSYQESRPAKYENQKPEFYMSKADNNIIPFPKNKKKLIELLPENKEKIENIINVSKTDFSKETDLVKLINGI